MPKIPTEPEVFFLTSQGLLRKAITKWYRNAGYNPYEANRKATDWLHGIQRLLEVPSPEEVHASMSWRSPAQPVQRPEVMNVRIHRSILDNVLTRDSRGYRIRWEAQPVGPDGFTEIVFTTDFNDNILSNTEAPNA